MTVYAGTIREANAPAVQEHPGAGHGGISSMPARGYKHCKKCGQDKPLDDFYNRGGSRDGKHAHCKPCHSGVITANRVRNPEKVRKWRAWRREDKAEREQRRERARKRRIHVKEDKAEYREKNPEKLAAKSAVAGACKRGVLVRPDACARCGADGPTQGHHADYSRQLDVEWLCAVCHGREHAELNRAVLARSSSGGN